MNIIILGAGGVGCSIAAKLLQHNANATITLLARGAHLQALQASGLHYITPERDETYNVNAVESIDNLPKQDVIIISTKTHGIADMAPLIPQLAHKNSLIIPVCNGIPWWFFQSLEGPLKGYTPQMLDPEGIIAANIPAKQLYGGLVYMGATLEAPGLVTNLENPRLLFGPTDNELQAAAEFAALCESASFKNPLRRNIREDIWRKLCWNTPFNPMSVVYEKNSIEMVDDPRLKAMAISIMEEMVNLAHVIGLEGFELDMDAHIAVSERAGAHKPSMLQDYESGKQLEKEAIIDVVADIAARTNIPTSTINQLQAALTAKFN